MLSNVEAGVNLEREKTSACVMKISNNPIVTGMATWE